MATFSLYLRFFTSTRPYVSTRRRCRHSCLPPLLMKAFLLLCAALIGIVALCLLPGVAANDAVAVSSTESSSGLYTIEGQVRLPRAGSKFVNARVLLNGGESVGVIRADGSFLLPLIAAGRTYTLDVAMPEYQFPTVRVDISNKTGQKGKIKASLASSRAKVAYPLVLRPTSKAEYFQKREPMNVLGMLKSPMVIMMIVTLVMVVVMPRMMNNMDPAELAEMKKMQSNLSIEGWKKKLEASVSEIKDGK